MRQLLTMIVILGVAAAILTWYKPGWWNHMRHLVPDSGIAGPASTRVYKWRDSSNGRWQISNQPPPAGIEYEAQDYREDLNVLPLPPQMQEK